MPRPWQTTACEIDLRPGGIFRTEKGWSAALEPLLAIADEIE